MKKTTISIAVTLMLLISVNFTNAQELGVSFGHNSVIFYNEYSNWFGIVDSSPSLIEQTPFHVFVHVTYPVMEYLDLSLSGGYGMAKRESKGSYSDYKYETSGYPIELHCFYSQSFDFLKGFAFYGGPGFGYFKYQTDYSYKDDYYNHKHKISEYEGGALVLTVGAKKAITEDFSAFVRVSKMWLSCIKKREYDNEGRIYNKQDWKPTHDLTEAGISLGLSYIF